MVDKIETRFARSLLPLLALILVTLFGVACGSSDPAAEAVEQYLQALIDSDEAEIQALLCSEKEAELEIQVLTFSTVSGAELRDASCQRVGDTDAVTCNGEIVALYGAEETVFPLVTYRVVQEDGEWKWCGETS